MASIQSRSSKRSEGTYEFLVEIDNNSTKGDFQTAMNDLKDKTKYLQVIGRDYKDSPDTIPWFPRNIQVSFCAMFSNNFSFSKVKNHILTFSSISQISQKSRQKEKKDHSAENAERRVRNNFILTESLTILQI